MRPGSWYLSPTEDRATSRLPIFCLPHCPLVAAQPSNAAVARCGLAAFFDVPCAFPSFPGEFQPQQGGNEVGVDSNLRAARNVGATVAVRPQRGAGKRKCTDTPIHRYTDTPIHRYTDAPIRGSTRSGVGGHRRKTAAILHRYTGTPIHRYTDAPICRYADTPIRPWGGGGGRAAQNYGNTPIHRPGGGGGGSTQNCGNTPIHRYTDRGSA